MKVKVRRRKPAPVAAEQAKKTAVKTEFILDNKAVIGNRILVDRIPEPEFITMVDDIHYVVHHPRVTNAKTKIYPDIKISELARKFRLL